MSRVKIKYVHSWVDKRCGNAKPRYYFERRGFARMPLPGLPGSEEFMDAYRAALAGQTLPPLAIGAGRTKAGSIGALIVAYYGSSVQFLSLGASTQRAYRKYPRTHSLSRTATSLSAGSCAITSPQCWLAK